MDQWFLWLLNNHLKVLRFLCNVTISCARVCWQGARVRVAPANGSAHHLRDPRLFCPGCRSSIWISRDRSGDQRNNSSPDIRLLGQSVVIVIIIITDTEQKTLHQSLPIRPTYNLNLTSQNWRFQVARKRAGRLETSLQSWFLFLLNNFCCLIISVEVTKRKIQT